MRRPHLLTALALTLILAGCGGGGSSSASSSNITGASILSISKYATPVGTAEYGFYVTAVDDNGASYGSLGPAVMGTQAPASPAIYWPNPTTYVTVPVLDSTVYSQTLSGKSPDGAIFIGYTYDADNSNGPGRGFAYNPSTQQFHILAITIPGSSSLMVMPRSVTDAGVVTGALIYRPSSGPGVYQTFTYNLSDDTYQLGPDPWPGPVNGLGPVTYSQNYQYFGGALNATNLPVIGKTSTGASLSTDPGFPGSSVDYVSNDGSVAVTELTEFGGSSNIPEVATIWFPGKGTVSTYALEQKLEPGVFNGTALLTGSPLGHYITIGNVSEGGSLTRLVHVK